MENTILKSALKSKTVLRLLGMNKEWIQINNKWVDLASVNVIDPDLNDPSLFEDDAPTRSWWQFWRR